MPRLSLAAALLLSGCSSELPGEIVGTYRVTMHASENSCGPGGLPLRDGHAYRMQLREEEPRGFWRVPKAAPIEGRYVAGEFEFTTAMTLELGNIDAGTAGCLVQREESLAGHVEFAASDGGARSDASEERETALRGEHRISFRPDPNGRCATVVGPVNVFERLPCSALYRIDGAEVSDF